MSFKTIQFECQDVIGVLTLNRPDRLNAMSLSMANELRAFVSDLKNFTDIHVIIMRGAGRSFCAGVDLVDTALPAEEGRMYQSYATQQAFSDVVFHIRQAPQPFIAAIHGHAVGVGFSLAMACDMRIAAASARFNARMVRLGGSGGECGLSYFLPRVVGLAQASELMYTARWVDATTAEKIGLVSRVVPDDRLEDEAMELAREVVQNAPVGLRMTKEILNLCMDAPSLLETLHLENRTQVLCSFSEDYPEAVNSIIEKRNALFRNR